MSKFTEAMNHGNAIENQTIKFNKDALSLDDQIKKLQDKGMEVSDVKIVEQKLSIINYYRFEAYWYPFYNFKTEKFTTNISFDLVLNYYRFDNELRMLIFQSITYIEVAFRTQFAYQLSLKYGPHALLNESLFNDKNTWDIYIENSKSSYNTYKENFIKHFKNKYIEELPPIWAHVEFMSFGELIKWWYLLKNNKDKKEIIKILQLKASIYDIKIWLNNLRSIRNYCAHHSRLWNRAFANSIQSLKTGNVSLYKDYWNTDSKKSRRIFNSLIIIDHILTSININSFNIINETYKLTIKFKIHNLEDMGFPKNFELIQ